MHYLYARVFGNCLNNKFILIACALLFIQPLFPGTTGKISGVLTDKETGDPLIGANVMIMGTPLGAETCVQSCGCWRFFAQSFLPKDDDEMVLFYPS